MKATHPLSRKRRDVKIEVTMEIDAEEDGDFHEFQMLHRHSRIRRNAQQCGSDMCGGESDGFKGATSRTMHLEKTGKLFQVC